MLCLLFDRGFGGCVLWIFVCLVFFKCGIERLCARLVLMSLLRWFCFSFCCFASCFVLIAFWFYERRMKQQERRRLDRCCFFCVKIHEKWTRLENPLHVLSDEANTSRARNQRGETKKIVERNLFRLFKNRWQWWTNWWYINGLNDEVNRAIKVKWIERTSSYKLESPSTQ